MKIVYDHQIFSMQAYGGVSRYFVELAKQLGLRSDIELDLLAPLYLNRYLGDENLTTTIGKRIPEIPYSGKLLHSLNDVITYAWLKKHKPDIIHATYFSPIKDARGNRAKIIVTVHDMIHEIFPDDFVSYDHTARLKREAVTKADHVICVSNNTRKDLVRLLGVDPRKVSVVHHGVNQIVPGQVFDIYFPKKPFLLFVGKRGGYKNFSRLLDAFANNIELQANYVLVCFGGGRFSTRELTVQKHLGLRTDQVLWFGGRDAVLAELYKTASVLVYPSLYEGFGIPPLEAMSFDCPVVCSNGGSIPEVVGEAGEYFDPKSSEDMVRAIIRVINDAPYRSELKSKGWLQLEKYSWKKCSEETLEVYKSVVL